MDITADVVKKLREKTGVGLMDCKEALKHTNGDMEKAVDFLREKGLAKMQKRMGRVASEGSIASYIHTGGKVGAMVEINCETDFVAKTDQFQNFVKDVAMQITASNPCMYSAKIFRRTISKGKKPFTGTRPLNQESRKRSSTRSPTANWKNFIRKYAWSNRHSSRTLISPLRAFSKSFS